ncbi:MAG TPA: FAD-dependent oxidoreductase [Terriglobales bacterium]|nr:FAD-dependent oxidoreductase [Terriglobales bacterium]
MMRRSDALAAAAEHFDLCVIGGGATGAGCALDAQLRGLRTVLVEANDFASATSSASTKLIHGGIRYLREAVAHFDFGQIGVVKRALYERGYMLRNAPFLAGTMEFLIPCYSHWQKMYFGAGVKAYDVLAGNANLLPSRSLSRGQVLSRLPVLTSEGLVGAVSYGDGQFDDAAFNLALVRTFIAIGGIALNYARVVGFEKNAAGKLQAALLRDEISGRSFESQARAFVNATGPAGDAVRRLVEPNAMPLLKLSRGAHILFPLQGFEARDALLIPKTSDGRVIFAIPWMGRLLVGTTDEPLTEAGEVFVSREDVEYLLRHVNGFLQRPLACKQIVAAFAGIRPLIGDASRETKSLSRDHRVEVDENSGLISILGGKWTTYRAMSEDTINAVQRRLQQPITACPTRTYPLDGSANYSATFFETLVQKYGVTTETARHMSAKYGTNATAMLELAASNREFVKPIVEGFPAIEAEIVHAIRHDMAMTIEDILARRIGLQFYSWDMAAKAAPFAAHYLADELSWTDDQRELAIAEYLDKLQRMRATAGLGN